MQSHQEYADHDGRVGKVEDREASTQGFDEINHIAEADPIDHVA